MLTLTTTVLADVTGVTQTSETARQVLTQAVRVAAVVKGGATL